MEYEVVESKQSNDPKPFCVFKVGNPDPIKCFGTRDEADGFKKAIEEDIQNNDFKYSAPAP